jgi:transposase-like protein
MAKGKARDESKERRWRWLIEEWRDSGTTVRAFCEQHGVSEPSFYAWRRKLAQRDAQAPTFVPVRVVADEPPAKAGGLDLVLPGQRTLRVGPGFDAATLRRLLAVLEETPC